MNSSETLKVLDARIEARGMLHHPFYQAWTKGELSLDSLKDYAIQYYHHVEAFPTYLSAVHSNSPDPLVRRRILDNLIDEEAGDPNHPELWLRFAEGIGVPRLDVLESDAWAETKNLVDTFRSVCRSGSTAEGVGALYAYESQIPRVAEAKIDGLKSHYGIQDPRTLSYFEVHIEADREHAAVERALLESLIDGDSAPGVTLAVDSVLDALWEMLSGVSRRHGIEC